MAETEKAGSASGKDESSGDGKVRIKPEVDTTTPWMDTTTQGGLGSFLNPRKSLLESTSYTRAPHESMTEEIKKRRLSGTGELSMQMEVRRRREGRMDSPGPASGHKKKYRESIIERSRRMNSEARRGYECSAIKGRYQSLVILKKPQHQDVKCLETISSGVKSLVHVDQWSKLPSCSIDAFFDPDEDGRAPRTLVLVGAAGVGKTRIARKILLDWASGDLFQDRFEYVFYIQCRRPNQMRAEQTIETLVEYNEPGYGFPSVNPLLVTWREIEAESSKVLFIIDGFEELRIDKDPLIADPDKPSPEDSTLICLIRKEYLPESYIIITTRPAALGTLTQHLEQGGEEKRFVEILGFSEDDTKEYFNRFFVNTTHGELVFNTVRENDLLFTLCFAPVVCWIVCKAFKQQMEKKGDSVPDLRTTTSVYLLFLSSLLKPQSSDSAQSTFNLHLKRLCALAKEGLYEGKTLFEDSDVTRHGLDIPSIQSLFLNNDMFHKVHGTNDSYSFLHLSFQELFAALFFVLKDNETTDHTVSPRRDVIQLLEDYSQQRPQWMLTAQRYQWVLTVRFLFGLLSEERLHQMEKGFHWSVSSDVKPAVETWIKEEIFPQSVKIYEDQLDWFHCLYETQDEEFVKSATEPLKEITIRETYLVTRWSVSDFRALLFCLQNSLGLRQIDLSVNIEAEGLRALMPTLMKCCSLRMNSCSLNGSCCADLASVLKTNTSLTELNLSWNELGDSGVRELCEGLKDPLCTLRTLSLERTGLTDDVTRPLCLALRRNQSLQELDLRRNDFTGRSVASFIKLKESVPKIETEVLWSPSRMFCFPTMFPSEENRTQVLTTDFPAVVETYNEEEDVYCYRATFDGPGTFPCEKTGLCFEVGEAGTIEYKLLPWSDNLAQCGAQDLQIAGSLFDVTVQPGLVRAVYLPHFICLRDGDVDESKLQIAHFGANGEMTLEDPSEVQAFHVVRKNPTFSKNGVVSQTDPEKQLQVYGQALLYQASRLANITLHLYLIPDEVHMKKSLETDKDEKQKIEKPPHTTEPLYFGKSYTVESEPSSEINPPELLFERRDQDPRYSEIYRKGIPSDGVKIDLKDEEDKSSVWRAVVRKGDIIDFKLKEKRRALGDIQFKLKENRRTPDDIESKLSENQTEPKIFIQKHRLSLIARMGNITSIMEILRQKGILKTEEIDAVLAASTTNLQNSKLILMVENKGTESQQEFLLALQEKDRYFYNDLKKSN